jgi:hypothetical protein
MGEYQGDPARWTECRWVWVNGIFEHKWTNPTLTKILNSTSLDKNFITAWKSITKLVIFQSFVAKCCKIRIIQPCEVCNFQSFCITNGKWLPLPCVNKMTENYKLRNTIFIRILQHFATKLWNITNFVMLFQAVMKFLSRLVEIKILEKW